MAKKTLLTAEGLLEIQSELKVLKEERRPEVADKLKEAISFGDLSENSEYEDARNEQAQLELRIIELEEILKNYELIDTTKRTQKKQTGVSVGSTVTVKNAEGETQTFRIVGPTETDIFEGKISNESPIGSSFIGKEVGDIAEGKAGSGAFRFEILEVK